MDDIHQQLEKAEKNRKYLTDHPDSIPGDQGIALRAALVQKIQTLQDQVLKLELKKADLAILLLEENQATVSSETFFQGVEIVIRSVRKVIMQEEHHTTFYQQMPEETIAKKTYSP